ncbi:ABC transporter substrate-binding protein [Pseudonocardia ailaonensis]|uniref:ABC transporter substrate-binding protein n=1 Tax=Pseudonocardia ailaonensis TaxID=367279 RepID=A0ABN2N4A4_9PSEU
MTRNAPLLGRVGLRSTLVLAATAALALTACGGGGSGSSTAQGDIRVGTVLPLTGPSAATAAQYLAGIEAAIGAANDKGGINGRKVVLDKVDDGFEVPRTIAGAKKLAQQDDVVGIIGPYGTNAAASLVPQAAQLKVPMVGPLAYSETWYRPVNPYLFPLLPGTRAIYQAMTRYAVESKGARRVAVLATDGPVGDETIAGAQQSLTAAGLAPTTVIRVAGGSADYSGVLSQVKATGADAVVVQSIVTDLATMTKNAANVGLTAPFYAGGASSESSFATLAGSAAQGAFGVVSVDLSGSSAQWASYSENIRSRTKADPSSSFTAVGYTAAEVMLSALRASGDKVDAATVTARLADGTADTLAGPVAFSADDHLGIRKLLLTRVDGGKVTLAGDTLPVS